MKTIKSMNPSSLLDSKKLKLPLNLFRLNVNRLIQSYSFELGVQCSQIKIKPMKSRWGSCNSRGVIAINQKLKELPEVYLAYVAFHECLHLIHKNHGKEFNFLLRQKFPEVRTLNRNLKILGTELLK